MSLTQPPTGNYEIHPRRSITIFGGYAVRTILDPQGNPIITFAMLNDNGEEELTDLMRHLNRSQP